jgi:hypothetical protein
MDIYTIQNLLAQVSAINKKYEEIAKITGEDFNIFYILHLQSDETRLHSRFIGELLNPKGLHGQGIKFLQLFLQSLNLNDYTEKGITNTEIVIEECIGNIPDDYTKGGRIDIVIKPNQGNVIVIENKIYAIDQPMQLWRYNNHYPSAHLLYLTLYGKDPEKNSIECGTKILQKEIDFKCIAYNDHIIKWLELCKK